VVKRGRVGTVAVIKLADVEMVLGEVEEVVEAAVPPEETVAGDEEAPEEPISNTVAAPVDALVTIQDAVGAAVGAVIRITTLSIKQRTMEDFTCLKLLRYIIRHSI
jgi:hypothetical protein